jgi:hypothetical protein
MENIAIGDVEVHFQMKRLIFIFCCAGTAMWALA